MGWDGFKGECRKYICGWLEYIWMKDLIVCKVIGLVIFIDCGLNVGYFDWYNYFLFLLIVFLEGRWIVFE